MNIGAMQNRGREARCHVRVDCSEPATYAPPGQVTGSSLGTYSGGARAILA